MGDSHDFLRVLCRLRWFAVAGQALTIVIVTGPMAIPIAAAPLAAGVGVLAAFNLYAEWRLGQRRPARDAECFLHVLADIVMLTWQVAWSGGLENPFASLFLLPIALSIPALPRRWVLAVAGSSLAGYAIAAVAGSPLPHTHGLADDAFSLHKLGMLVNFVVSAAVLVYFLARITSAWRASEREIARLRERFTRNEGILALATHAASVAHELNTPLGTMTLMVDDLLDGGADAPSREELSTLRRLLQDCRDRVRALAAPALHDAAGRGDAGVDLDEVVSRWQLLRPAVELRRSGGLPAHARIDTAVGHLLQALLNNAADAGEQAGRLEVDLHLAAEGGRLRGEIRDFGAGFGPGAVPLPGTRFGSDKPGGLGIGLALSHATVERLGGSLTMHAAAGGPGLRVVFELPMGGTP